MKRSFLVVLSLLLVITLSFVALATTGKMSINVEYSNIKLQIDGTSILPKDASGKVVEPFTYNGTTYLPVRAISNALGKNVAWDDKTSTVIITTPKSLQVDYIDVGQADAALVQCNGQTMLIDGGNVADSNKIYSFLQQKGIKHLDYIIATHAHEDHVGGLAGALNYATVGTAYCSVKTFDSEAFRNFVKYLDKQKKKITVPSAGSTFKLGDATVQILAPQKDYEDPNNTSIVLRVVLDTTSFLFTGDAERDAETDIITADYDLGSTVLKVGHHGSETSTTYPFLRAIMPQYAVISVGKDNTYGHPDDNTLSRLRDAGVTVFRTDLQGTITAISDGKSVTFKTERNADVVTNPTTTSSTQSTTEKITQPPTTKEPTTAPTEPPVSSSYIGNKNSKIFHRSSCSSLPIESNRVYFSMRQSAIDQGYTACKICKP